MGREKSLGSAITALVSLGVMGCSATFGGSVEHNTQTNETIIKGSVEVEIETESNNTYSAYQSGSEQIEYQSGSEQFDANKLAIDMSGTTIALPSSGWTTVKIISQNGVARLSQRFQWARSGEFIFFADPTAVNYWVNGNIQDGERVEYASDPIGDGGASGQQTVASTIYYDGYEKAYSQATFVGSGDSGCGIGFCEVE